MTRTSTFSLALTSASPAAVIPIFVFKGVRCGVRGFQRGVLGFVKLFARVFGRSFFTGGNP